MFKDQNIMVVISQLGKHFPARAPEWFNAGIMLSWGAYVLLHPSIFMKESFSGLYEMTATAFSPVLFWGWLTVLVGTVRGSALFVNGAYSRTPLIRLVTSAISAFVWSQVVIGFWQSDLPSTGVVTYSWLVFMDIVSAYRASKDVAVSGSLQFGAMRITDDHGHGSGFKRWLQL